MEGDTSGVEHAEDSFMVLNAGELDEISPLPDDAAEESSDSSFLDIDLDDVTDDEEMDTIESVELDDEHQVNQELEEVRNDMVRVTPDTTRLTLSYLG